MRILTGVLIAAILSSCSDSNHKEASSMLAPDENRFSKEVFVDNLYEPTELVALPNGKLLFTQRRGGIKQYDLATEEMVEYDRIAVHSKYEDGLMGIALDPDFKINKWLYLYYAPPGDRPVHFLSRFKYTTKGLIDEVVVLEVDVQRDECCHTGGSVEFGPDGLLYLSTGDDTNPFASDGFAPFDGRDGRSSWDARRSSSNTNDLRGKILRIKPLADGSYVIPEGNLFEDEDPRTRPEIYVMGCRNPYRISIDSKRGWLFWGDVGPDAGQDNLEKRGPRGHDEFNVALAPGYFGWPLFVADNKPYRAYDFGTKEFGDFFDPKMPINTSQYNTGLDTLPPANPAKIFYPYARTDEFPEVKYGSRNAMAGPVYYSDEYESSNKYPSFFDGRVFFYDWMRGFVYSLSLDENGNPVDWYPFMASTSFNNLIDMTFGPDGQLYIIEYGTGWFTQNENAVLARLKYEGGNRAPIIRVETGALKGASPLKVSIDASGSIDFDGDAISFNWEINGDNFQDSVFNYEFTKPGIYYPELVLKDNKGNKTKEQFVVEVGNEPPSVEVQIEGNRKFFWKGRQVRYNVSVTDLESGSLGKEITDDEVEFSIMHFQSSDQAEVLGHQMPISNGKTLMADLDCKGCHKEDQTSIGPSYKRIAEKYATQNGANAYLANKIINGGGGVWGEQAMSAHPDLPLEDANAIVDYILSFAESKSMPLNGNYTTSKSDGNYLFSASYEDAGKKPLKPIRTTSNVWLMSNQFDPANFDYSNGPKPTNNGKGLTQLYDKGTVGYFGIDLTGIGSITFNLLSYQNTKLMLRAGSPDGELVGEIELGFTDGFGDVSVPVDYDGMLDLYIHFDANGVNANLGRVKSITFQPKVNK